MLPNLKLEVMKPYRQFGGASQYVDFYTLTVSSLRVVGSGGVRPFSKFHRL